jgi:hypothetical protein
LILRSVNRGRRSVPDPKKALLNLCRCGNGLAVDSETILR